MIEKQLNSELNFFDLRSQGPGGQNVNKLNTKIELRFNIHQSKILNEEQKNLILGHLASKINKNGVLILSSQSERSQLRNKKLVIDKFNILINSALRKKKPRIKTKPSKKAVEKRLELKKKIGQKKEFRKKIN
jgi:ribosome-associated protein